MVSYIRRNRIFFIIISCLLLLCVAFVCVDAIEKGADAANEISNANDILITHLTDIHYYPFRLGYYGNTTQSSNHDFFYNWIADKNTKLWLEAEAMIDHALLKVKEITTDYIIFSGDVGQDGELLSHIDLANKLRKLQNDLRMISGNDGFQIFVVMGNHDLYNPESYRFDNASGLKETFYYATRMDVALIYAGLGYPNISASKATEYYSFLSDDLQGNYAFTQSYLSSDFNWAWQFVKEDSLGNTRYFTYDAGASNQQKEDLSMKYLLDNSLVNTIDNSTNFAKSHQSYMYEKFSNGLDIDIGQLTFLAVRKDNDFSVVGMDVVLSNSIGGHILGGQLQNSTQNWMTKNKSIVCADAGTVVIGGSHHSIVPHWEMEENITTGFIVYNWKEVADFLADFGMRYVYTGHMHANDTVSHVSFNGNQIIDMESSANCSVGTAIKTTRIHYGTVGTAFAEQAYLSSIANSEVDFETENVQLFSKVFKNDKYGYVAKNKVSSFLDYDRQYIVNYSGYAQRRVYDNAVVSKLNEFLRPSITDMLGDIVNGISFSVGSLSFSLGNYAQDIVQLANNLIKAISTDILTDYTYKGDNPVYKQEEYKVFGYLEELVNDIVYYELADGIGIYTLVIDAYINHNAGTEVNSFEALSAVKQEAINSLFSGEFVELLIEKIMDKEKGLYRLIEGLQNTTLDLSEGLSYSFSGQLELLGNIIGFNKDTFKLDVSKFNLGEILKVAGKNDIVKNLLSKIDFDIDLENSTLTEIIDNAVEKYLTDSLKKSVGEYAFDVIKNFAVDGRDADCNSEKEMLLTIRDFTDADSKVYTFIDKSKPEIITVENGKKPSMVTTNFGSDPASRQSFTYFTDRRVTASGIEYVETAADGTYNKAAATYAAGESEIYGTTKPLIDLGIWCQSGYVELGRHTVSLTGLKASTTYAYRVGDRANEYWSDWYTFTTAPKEDADFEVLVGSDLQSSTSYAYERLSTIYDKLDKVFEDKIAFMINAGDVVDNGRNLSQYEWWLNSAPKFNASLSMVVAPGNHDSKSFTPDKASNMAYYGGLTNTAYFALEAKGEVAPSFGASQNARLDEYNYLYTHFNYGLPAAQTSPTGFYYSFNYSGVHFTVLNTNDISAENNLSKAQFDWLVADLDAAKDLVKVVIMHKSLYSAGSHSYDKDVIALRAQLTPVFGEKGVSLVIAGHDHTYTETYYLDGEGKKMLVNANGKNEITGKGTLYLTMGTMGEKFYNYVSNPKVPVNTGYSLHDDNAKLSDPTFGKLSYNAATKTLSYMGYEYIREMDELGNLKSGEIAEINKSLDWNTLTALIISGLVVVLVFTAVIASAIHNVKIRKLND